ncbi:S8 family peptidase [Shewanella sedimentimangrovi]|uniref:S8/S53 family peptidase n=1 Tax=Shewanella sedimentimangrovi TaxID=2814293 RepID=A0ABX7R158_9GAMM|nr:S8/S53 family peptidase [Shewanella sedimentimangrovi]QSX37419.1 S8/S53 family peptidase [Shewanella sedimentimangrovi]
MAAKEADETIGFFNLGERIELSRNEDAPFFQSSLGIKFQVSERLIVLTSLGADTLQQVHPGIVKVQQLASLAKEDVFLLTLTPGARTQVFTLLAQHRGIRLVQPDLAQEAKNYSATTQSTAQVSPLQPFIPQPPCNPHCYQARIAIIDDGFDFNHNEFSELEVLFSYDADTRQADASPKSPADFHGTMVAGILGAKQDNKGAEGLAPDAGIIAIRQVSTWTSDMILAFSVARMMRADIINVSWTLPFLPQPLAELLEDMLKEPSAPYIVVAAGNLGLDACEKNALTTIASVLTVGARNRNGDVAAFSNRGNCVDLYAPFGLKSVTPKGYGLLGGTSSSAAFVSGVIAHQLRLGRRPSRSELVEVMNQLGKPDVAR